MCTAWPSAMKIIVARITAHAHRSTPIAPLRSVDHLRCHRSLCFYGYQGMKERGLPNPIRRPHRHCRYSKPRGKFPGNMDIDREEAIPRVVCNNDQCMVQQPNQAGPRIVFVSSVWAGEMTCVAAVKYHEILYGPSSFRHHARALKQRCVS